MVSVFRFGASQVELVTWDDATGHESMEHEAGPPEDADTILITTVTPTTETC